MKVIVTKNHNDSCVAAADIIINLVNDNPKAILGLATGGTVEQIYEELVKSCKAKKVSFKDVSTVNLDEYVGLSPDHTQSYRYYMNNHLFDHVDIDKKNTFVPQGDIDPQKSLKDFQDCLSNNPRDFQLLGVGSNGHIAFNEPDSILHSNAHIVDIAPSTIQANSRYFASPQEVPKKAFTQGMGDILRAKKLVLVATGENKVEAVKYLLSNDEITTSNPCTFIKAHIDVTIIIDQELADLVNYK